MKFIIEGAKKLKGEVEIRGAKNSVLKILAASLLFKEPLLIENIPLIEDFLRQVEILKDLGVEIQNLKNRVLKVDPRKISKVSLAKNISERLRASIVLVGPLLAVKKRAIFPHPGGCVIGKRPIDLFLEGWRAFGAKISKKDDFYEIKTEKLKGIDFTFKKVSVTATETLMMTAVLAQGRTILRNAACEPEISSLARFLNKCGAKIKGAGTPFIEIIGTNGRLLKPVSSFKVIPDRIEAGSFLILGALLADPLLIKNCQPEHLSVLIAVLKETGAQIEIGKNEILVRKAKALKSVDIVTREYPGFPTDLQAPFTVLMTQARGQSMIFETIFDGRLNYIEDLNRMGAKIIMCDPHRILVSGPTPLRGREIETPDLRAGLAFVIAGLVAKGVTIINNVYQIDRGYEKIDERLINIGAKIKRTN